LNLSLNLSPAARAVLGEIGKALLVLSGTASAEGNFHAQTSPAQISLAAPPDDDLLTVAGLVNEFLRAKARAGRSDRYLRALRNSLVKFSAGRGSRPVASVTVGDIERWLHGSSWQVKTKRGYLGDVSVMLNYGVRRGYLSRNVAAAVELPRAVSVAPQIHTPAQMRAVLEFAKGHDLNIMRALAVRYFAGLRSAEVERMTESLISSAYIEVPAVNAKSRRRRLVKIQPVLAHWLGQGGVLPVRGNQSNTWRDFTAALKRATGVPWFHNVTRHSFVSYHLAEFGNAGKTALEAGHSEAMLFAHYRELVTPEAAAEYWAMPNIQAESAAGGAI
jgi:hypothetical protein